MIKQDELLKAIPCPFTIHEVCRLLNTYVEQVNDQGLRIEIRGMFRDIWTKQRVLLMDWHFLKSWSEHFEIMGLFSLPFDEERKPWPDVRYLLYEGLGELRLRLFSPHKQNGICFYTTIVNLWPEPKVNTFGSFYSQKEGNQDATSTTIALSASTRSVLYL